MDLISFASDNCAPADDRVMDALAAANSGSAKPYGNDELTAKAVEMLKKELGGDPDIYFVYNGTAANVISVRGSLRYFEAVIASDISHINTDECGAIESVTGCRILPLSSRQGRIYPEDAEKWLEHKGSVHQAQPRMVSVTQATEHGTVYTLNEIKRWSDFARENSMFLHMDGARIANACVHEGCSLAEMTSGAGVDILSLGISKNGGMFGDAVAVFNETLKKDFRYNIKPSLNLHSKNRYIACQFFAFFEDGLFYSNAKKANNSTAALYSLLAGAPLDFIAKPQANSLFVRLKPDIFAEMSKKYFFYNFGEDIYRIMTTYRTTEAEVREFADDLLRLL